MNTKSKFAFEAADELSYDNIKSYYDQFINPGLSKLYRYFSFGKDIFDTADGMYMFTRDGKKILDFTGGLGVLSHGHNHPRILAARIKFQQEKRIEVHKVIFSSYMALLAQKISSMLPDGLDKCFFPNSGAEANEGALKLAYKYHSGQREFVLHSDRAFHGKLIATGSLGGNYFENDLFQKIPNTSAFKYNDIDSLKLKINYLKKNNHSNVYAIIVEPFSASCMQGCSNDFLTQLRKICDEEDIVLIFDEVYCGMAKTGELFNFMRVENLVPDILTMSKSFGGGKSSISAYVTKNNIFDKAYGNFKDANLHSSTYTGFGEEAITAIEALDIMIDEDYVSKSKNIFRILNKGLLKLKEKFPNIIKEVRGSGTMNGIIIYPPLKFIDKIFENLPQELVKEKYNVFSQLVIAAIMEDLYSSYNILTIPQDRLIRLESGEIERFAYLAIKPSCIASNENMEYFLTSLDNVLSKGLVNIILQFIKKSFFSK